MASQRSTLNRGTIIGLVLAMVGILGGCLSLSVWTAVRHVHEDTPQSETAPKEETHSVEVRTTPDWPEATSDDPGVDDGELHDARSTDVEYQMREDMWAISEVQHVDAYNMDIACSFMIRYPVLENAGKHTDEINQLLQNTAKQTVRTYYEDPDQDTIDRFRRLVAESGDFKPSNADALLSSTVDYAITYNNDRLLSVCFSDSYYLGSDAGGFIQLRTVNVDLRTGKVYELDDVLSVDRVVASSFVDNLLRTNGEDANGDGRIEDDECFTVKLVGREALVEALQGTGELVENGRVSTCLFVDGNGQPNLGANYWLSSDGGFVRGWWDVTISDAQLEDTRKESKFWKLLDK